MEPSLVSTAPHFPDRIGVLVVDDDRMVRGLLQLWLQQAGFDVWLASDGAEANTFYQQQMEHVDVVLLEVRMPGLDGPETLAALRRQNPQVRGCFMTGHTGAYSEQELLQCGAALVITKPFHLQTLANALRLLTCKLPVDMLQLSGTDQA
jgi:DNA-binding response OmpR family regulator